MTHDQLLLFLDVNFSNWMSQNILQLNEDKPEIIIIGSEAQRENTGLPNVLLLTLGTSFQILSHAVQRNYMPNNREPLLD